MKAGRLILHLGHGKTGSTSIQRSLRASGDVLKAAGILFPDTGRHDNHQFLFPHLHGSLPDDPVQLASLGPSPAAARKTAAQYWEALGQAMLDNRPDVLVLSCENQFRPFTPAALKRLTEHCQTLAEQTEVVAYLRSPASFFLSMAQQDVKKRPEFRRISPSRCRDTLEPFLDHGPGPVTALGFSRATLAGGDVVQDFVTRFLPEVDPAQLTRDTTEENTSVSAEAMALLQEMFRGTRSAPRAFRKDLKALRKIIVETDAKVDGSTRPVLFDHVRAAVEARVTELDWLHQCFKLTFADLRNTDMSRDEAEVIYAGLHDIADICAVDNDRKEALWQAAVKTSTARLGPLRRLFGG